MASFRALRRALCTVAEAAPAPAPAPAPAGRWERLKQSKAAVWCRGLLSDYKEACREVVVGARDHPLKASVYMGLLGGTYACFYTKPDQSSFQSALLDRSNQLALLSPWIRNGTSDLHVQNLVTLRNQGRLRHLNLGFVSLVYNADFDPQSALYEATCSNLSVPWRELPERVLDVGFAGRWWILDKKMEDFDVNEAEYKHLPPHMQVTAPPSVQEVERNEKLHKDSWLPIMVQGEDVTGEDVTGEDVTGEDVTGEDVTGEDVTGEDVTGEDVTGEDVTGEDVTGEDVTGEDLTGEDVTGEDVAAADVTGEDVAAADVAAAEETPVNIQVVDIMEMLDIKEVVKSEDMTEDSVVLQTLDTKEEVQTLDTDALETVDVKEETEETTVDVHVVEMVDTVAMEMVDTSEDGVSEEESVEQTAAQSMKN
ncbi:mitochondrial import inner membrane translocase subunit Tim29 [Eucyclogobius newberryi]|uniref:mitochondrial import inner membrane translocase subunit Tim29 n=1 Tax=Eucyclogobius newberryi TaxID=166745 RepID=UPI003B592EF7